MLARLYCAHVREPSHCPGNIHYAGIAHDIDFNLPTPRASKLIGWLSYQEDETDSSIRVLESSESTLSPKLLTQLDTAIICSVRRTWPYSIIRRTRRCRFQIANISIFASK